MNEDLAAQMLAQRRVMIAGVLDASTVTNACAQLMYLDGLSDAPVSVIINCGDGSADDALPLVDTMALMRAPVTIDVLGRASGPAAAVVASAPGERRMGPTAVLDFGLRHTTELKGNADELQRATGEVRATHDVLASAVAARSGQPAAWVLAHFDRGGAILPADALQMGLIDAVR